MGKCRIVGVSFNYIYLFGSYKNILGFLIQLGVFVCKGKTSHDFALACFHEYHRELLSLVTIISIKVASCIWLKDFA